MFLRARLQEFLLRIAVVVVLAWHGLTTRTLAAEVSGPQIEFGADYYAEDWPPERTELDARLMEQGGFRAVRLVDTNWERLEPDEGRYNFGWLDRVIEILSQHGIRAILGTSSYVPPAWLIEKHPEFYLVNKNGVRHRWGGMGFMCLNNPLYRQVVGKLVTALATHYASNPGVIGWQIDNELGTWGYECYDTKYCVPKFQRFLQNKFHTLDELNRRWLTVSYGHAYTAWSQIPLNWSVGEEAHQAPLELEAQRFFTSNAAEFLDFQAKILRQLAPRQFITHNLSGPSRNGNAFAFRRPLDFLSYDNYPRVGQYEWPGFAVDLVRGFNRGGKFLILEHRSGYTGPYSLGDATPPEGQIRLWGWQSLAHGADGVLFFRWRTSIGGSEQYWGGLLDYDGKPGRAFPEVSRMGAELKKVGTEIAGAETPASVAEIMSFDSLWALHVGDASFPYYDQLAAFHHAFKRLGMNVDFVEPEEDLSRYKVVIAPTLHVADQPVAAALERFAQNGGTLILTLRSGFKDQDNLATQQPLLGGLASLAKIRVSDYTLLQGSPPFTRFGFPAEEGSYRSETENQIHSVSSDWPGTYKARVWADILEPAGARTLFRYQKGYYTGKAAVTEARQGQGKVIYVGTLLEPAFYLNLARRVSSSAGIPMISNLPEGIDVALRQKNHKSFLFLLNFTSVSKSVALPGTLRDLFSGQAYSREVELSPLDLKILYRE